MSKIKVILISLSVWMLAACAGSRGPTTLPSGEPAYDDAAIGLGKSFSVNSCTKSRFFHFLLG